MMASLLSTMSDEEPPLPKTSLIEVHDSVWQRIVKVSGPKPFGLHTTMTETLRRLRPLVSGFGPKQSEI